MHTSELMCQASVRFVELPLKRICLEPGVSRRVKLLEMSNVLPKPLPSGTSTSYEPRLEVLDERCGPHSARTMCLAASSSSRPSPGRDCAMRGRTTSRGARTRTPVSVLVFLNSLNGFTWKFMWKGPDVKVIILKMCKFQNSSFGKSKNRLSCACSQIE